MWWRLGTENAKLFVVSASQDGSVISPNEANQPFLENPENVTTLRLCFDVSTVPLGCAGLAGPEGGSVRGSPQLWWLPRGQVRASIGQLLVQRLRPNFLCTGVRPPTCVNRLEAWLVPSPHLYCSASELVGSGD